MNDKKQPQQQNFGPAPVDPNVAYQQQPVNQQYFAQPQAAPVQYVVMAQSLKGVRGWLLFFAIVFGLSGLGYIGYFFAAMTDLGNPTSIVNLIFSPLLAAALITTVVFIAMEKSLGKWLAIGSLAFIAVYNVITSIVSYASGSSDSSSPAMLISTIITGLIMSGLFILYFFVSKRVKETLVN